MSANLPCPRCGALSGLELCPKCLLSAGEPAPSLGGLELIAELGRGGMGSVWRARDPALDREVAVKLLPPEVSAQPEQQARLAREARTLALLNHPNVVQVHRFGAEDGQAFIEMELIDGLPLSQLLPLPVGRALNIAVQVCDALQAAHSRGLVHRDIKPENVMVCPGDRVKVTDFGIARPIAAPESWKVTAEGKAAGTPAFMPPEAFAGAPPDPRFDVYGLAALLYQTVSGKIPAAGSAPLPGRLGAIIQRGLAADPARRYPDAASMRAALSSLAEQPAASEIASDDDWSPAAALLLTAATAVALWAFVVSLTPKVFSPGEVPPLFVLDPERLADGRFLARARFELFPILLATVSAAVGLATLGLLRRRWRAAEPQLHSPDRPIRWTRWVFALGMAQLAVYLGRLLLEHAGHRWPRTFAPIAGGLSELALVYLMWRALLEAMRTGRPLRREPLLFLGLAFGLVPPAAELLRYLSDWQP